MMGDGVEYQNSNAAITGTPLGNYWFFKENCIGIIEHALRLLHAMSLNCMYKNRMAIQTHKSLAIFLLENDHCLHNKFHKIKLNFLCSTKLCTRVFWVSQ